jgi:hypothetical protein
MELLELLIARYELAEHDEEPKLVRIRVFNVLQCWAKQYWYDFSKDCPALSDRAIAFLDSVGTDNASAARTVKDKIERTLGGNRERITRTEQTQPAPDQILPNNLNSFSIFDVSPKEIAIQLTLIEWKIWEKIQPWELLGLSWTKKDKQNLAPHVLEITDRFNYVSGWVASSICTVEKKTRTWKDSM